jgi:hypothetical protein
VVEQRWHVGITAHAGDYIAAGPSMIRVRRAQLAVQLVSLITRIFLFLCRYCNATFLPQHNWYDGPRWSLPAGHGEIVEPSPAPRPRLGGLASFLPAAAGSWRGTRFLGSTDMPSKNCTNP